MKPLTHFDAQGQADMIDVASPLEKPCGKSAHWTAPGQ